MAQSPQRVCDASDSADGRRRIGPVNRLRQYSQSTSGPSKSETEGNCASACNRSQSRKGFVRSSVAFSFAMPFGTGLLVNRLQKLNWGYPRLEQKNNLLFWVYPTKIGYESTKEIRLYDDLLEKFKTIPSVLHAS